jgi:general secretion pathway protein J
MAGEPRDAARLSAGVTLVELLIAMTLLGLLMGLLLGGLQLATRSWESGGERAIAGNEIAMTQAFLRRELGQARLEATEQEGEEPRLLFRGAPQRVEFVSRRASRYGGGLYHFDVELLGLPGERLLELRYRPFHPEPDVTAEEPSERVVLLDGLAEGRFEYFGSLDPQDPPAWHDDWQAWELPQLVRVQLQWPDGRERWPELVVATRVQVDPGPPRGRR